MCIAKVISKTKVQVIDYGNKFSSLEIHVVIVPNVLLLKVVNNFNEMPYFMNRQFLLKLLYLYSGDISLFLPRLPKLPSQCCLNGLGNLDRNSQRA